MIKPNNSAPPHKYAIAPHMRLSTSRKEKNVFSHILEIFFH